MAGWRIHQVSPNFNTQSAVVALGIYLVSLVVTLMGRSREVVDFQRKFSSVHTAALDHSAAHLHSHA
jgi:hypothetical protein